MAEGPETVYLGQFTDENAEAIAARLEELGIVWWWKRSGMFGRFFFAGEWGVRLFVEEDRLDEAEGIAEEVAGTSG